MDNTIYFGQTCRGCGSLNLFVFIPIGDGSVVLMGKCRNSPKFCSHTKSVLGTLVKPGEWMDAIRENDYLGLTTPDEARKGLYELANKYFDRILSINETEETEEDEFVGDPVDEFEADFDLFVEQAKENGGGLVEEAQKAVDDESDRLGYDAMVEANPLPDEEPCSKCDDGKNHFLHDNHSINWEWFK